MLELLHQVPLFAWLPEEAPEILNGCFDLETEKLEAGETRRTDGRAGCLLSGSAVFQPEGTASDTLSAGEPFCHPAGRSGLQTPPSRHPDRRLGLRGGLVCCQPDQQRLLPGLLVPRPAPPGDRQAAGVRKRI